MFGQPECLKYAHENGCDWDWFTCVMAAAHGHLDCLKYAHENGCQYDKNHLLSMSGHQCKEYIEKYM